MIKKTPNAVVADIQGRHSPLPAISGASMVA
jgi:hypothetical protein